MDYKVNKLIYIIVIIILYFFIYCILFGNRIKVYLDENWKQIRCYPHIIPIAGLSNRIDGSNFFSKTVINFNNCSSNFIKTILGDEIKPAIQILHGIREMIKYIYKSMNNIRGIAAVTRNLFSTLVENTTDRISNTFSTMMYLQEKLKVMFKKQAAIFEILKQFSSTLPFLFQSFRYGPVPRFLNWITKYIAVMIALIIICLLCTFGGFFMKLFLCPICFICFSPDTIVDLDNNSNEGKLIKYVNVGERIRDNIVLGKIFIKKRPSKIYNYKGIKVTANHLVFDNYLWKRICNTESKSENINTELYCLITNNNTIFSRGNKFRDYQETRDIDIVLSSYYKVAKHLNNNKGCIKTTSDKYHTYYWGFSAGTLIKIDGDYIPIENIVNNPYKYNVEGVVELGMDCQLYSFRGVIVSGNTLVNDNGIWLRVFQANSAKKVHSSNKIYNIITRDNLITVGSSLNEDILFTDFIETSDPEVNTSIDKQILDRLNLLYTFEI